MISSSRSRSIFMSFLRKKGLVKWDPLNLVYVCSKCGPIPQEKSPILHLKNCFVDEYQESLKLIEVLC